MESEDSLPCSQELSSGLYREPNEPSPHSQIGVHGITNSTERSSRLMWNLKVHYRVRKGPSLELVLSQMILVKVIDLEIIRGAESFMRNYSISLG